jgi:hypothetical protein
MAVRQGYGKIAGTDALVFAYDTGDTRSSYRGEPTVNYVSSGDASLAANIDCTSGNVTTTLPNGSTGTARRITVTGDTLGGIIRASLDTSLTIPQGGVSYTISCWIRNSGAVAVAAGWEPEVGAPDSYLRPNNESGFIGNYGSSSQPNTVSSTWTKVVYTYSYNSTQTSSIVPFIYFGHPVGGSGSGIGATIDFYQIQIEVKSHATPYTPSTRSATQGLLDLNGRSTPDLTNVSFDSNAQMLFDGTDDYISVTNNTSVNSIVTIETIIYIDSSKTYAGIIGSNVTEKYEMLIKSATNLEVSLAPSNYVQWNNILSAGTWIHLCLVATSGVAWKLYKNGVDLGTPQVVAGYTVDCTSVSSIYLGRIRNDSVFSYIGKIPIAKVYNRALTANEVRNNYRHYKTRFDI